MLSYRLPDDRVLLVERTADESHWHLRLAESTDEIVGEPLQSALAELLGYSVASDEWPEWIDDLAAEIERALW